MHKTITDVTVKDAEKGTVSAVFSTFNVIDKDGDVTVPGAIKDGAEVVISAYGHRSHAGELPVGKGVIRTSDTEAILEGQFFLNTTAGRDTFEVVKGLGEAQEWSYSLHDVVSKSGEFEGQRANFLESIFVKEVSPVLIGAGVNTRTLATKGLSLQDQITDAMDVVSEVVDSTERVVALRAEKGKSLSTVNSEGLVGLCESLERLKALLDTKADEEAAEDIPEDIKELHAEHLGRDLFSSLDTNGA